MKRKSTPSYLLHKQSGRGRATWTDSAGKRQQQLLPGPFDSSESRTAFARLQLQLELAPQRPTQARAHGLTVNEVMVAFMDWAPTHYRAADGRETSEIRELKWSIRFVRELYGTVPARDFGPLALKAVREKMIQVGWCRSVVNKRVDRVKRAFKWCVSEQLVPPSVHQALSTVSGLRRGRSEAPESKPILPVDPVVVSITLPFLNRHLRAMVEVQRLTGMRPGEVCQMRLVEIDRTADLWMYRPSHHKTLHHGKDRVVIIGPRGRAILEAFIADGSVVDPSGPLFSPWRAREERFAEMRLNRKSKVPPSQANRRKARGSVPEKC